MINKRTAQDLELERIFSLIKHYSLTEEGEKLLSTEAVTGDEKIVEQRAQYIERIISQLVSGLVKPTRFPSLNPIFTYCSQTHASLDGQLINSFSEYLAS